MSVTRRAMLQTVGLLACSLAWPAALAASTKPSIRVYKDPT